MPLPTRGKRKHSRSPKKGRWFTGKRFDTQLEKTIVTGDGRTLGVRADGTKYPKLTTISLCESTRRIYSFIRNSAPYPNFNDLLLDVVENAIKTRSLPLNERDLKKLEGYLYSAKVDRNLMAEARKNADKKGRYYHRKTR